MSIPENKMADENEVNIGYHLLGFCHKYSRLGNAWYTVKDERIRPWQRMD